MYCRSGWRNNTKEVSDLVWDWGDTTWGTPTVPWFLVRCPILCFHLPSCGVHKWMLKLGKSHEPCAFKMPHGYLTSLLNVKHLSSNTSPPYTYGSFSFLLPCVQCLKVMNFILLTPPLMPNKTPLELYIQYICHLLVNLHQPKLHVRDC